MDKKYLTNIGIEVHAELKTKTKLLCSCSTEFGANPNSNCCPICWGLPGATSGNPWAKGSTRSGLSKTAIKYGVKIAAGLNCDIAREVQFDRKNYFYPDLPKAFQITQFFHPIGRSGHICFAFNGKNSRVQINEIHLEEDAGKLIHDANYSLVDYNRAGVPLIEIVSEPNIESSEEAIAYLEAIRDFLIYLDVSECKMEEGGFRADINISIREASSDQLGRRTELKNINSFRSIGLAIENERSRQIKILESGGEVAEETRRWDEARQETISMRTKDESKDYMYLPEPDVPIIILEESWIEEVRNSLPELRHKKIQRFTDEYGITLKDSKALTSNKAIGEFYEEALIEYKKISRGLDLATNTNIVNWIIMDLLALLNEKSMQIENAALTAQGFSQLVHMVENGAINRGIGREILNKMIAKEIDPREYIKTKNLGLIDDKSLLRERIIEIIKANPQAVEDYKSGKTKALTYLMGQTMKAMKGQANAKLVEEIIVQTLED